MTTPIKNAETSAVAVAVGHATGIAIEAATTAIGATGALMDGVEELGRLRALLRPDFLARVGWDPAIGVVCPARDDPLLGLRECAVVDCQAGVRASWADLCISCWQRHKATALDWEQFVATPSGKTVRGERLCGVASCPRPARSVDRLCGGHGWQRERHPGLSVEQWLSRPEVVPLPSYGPCRVPACVRQAARTNGLCPPHSQRWNTYRQQQATTEVGARDLESWARQATPISAAHLMVLKGLPEQAQVELLVGLQRRTDAGLRTLPTTVRYLVKLLHQRQAGSVFDLVEVRSTTIRHDAGVLLRAMLDELRCALSDPERERCKDVWQLVVFGLPGVLDFTRIEQPWLREATKQWVAEDLPLHRGRQAAATSRDTVNAVQELSSSLRACRDDGGMDLAVLGRGDIVGFTNRLAHQERVGVVTGHKRLRVLRRVRRFLDDLRALGLTRPGGPAAGLPGEFIMRRTDTPTEQHVDRPGRDLSAAVLTVINDHLHVLEERAGIHERRITELLIDTGRRPDEICVLPWDCLERDADGKPALVYTDAKNNRTGRRLPISEATAQIVLAQQTEVRRQFPDTALGELVLFPRVKGNRDGTKPIPVSCFTNAHRVFINTIAHLLTGPDGQPLDPATVVPYCYRHSYAQRHADEGVNPDVLRELMGHRSTRTTTGYYRVTEKRVRAAVDRVSVHQVDGNGRRVFAQITGLLAHEHARIRVGQVAVPFGVCTEPTNVKAGGQACPYKYTCLGCGHFRSDPSYLPELKSYLQQLLADRERIMAATDLEDWARDRLKPSDEEITKLRNLIRRVEAGLDNLSEPDRTQITEAISVIRNTRQVVSLGMPTIRPPAIEQATEQAAGTR